MPEPERRRRRPAVSCSLCRKRKIRCNRETPCSNCVRSKNLPCVYDNPPQGPQQTHQQGRPVELRPASDLTRRQNAPTQDAVSDVGRGSSIPGHPLVTPSTTASSPASQPAAEDVEYLKGRIRQLEAQLSKTRIPSQPRLVTAPSSRDKTPWPEAGSLNMNIPWFGEAHSVNRSILHKRRLFGQTHWMNGVTTFQDILDIMQSCSPEETQKAVAGMRRCKDLGRVIKARREPAWPLLPSPDLPPKEVCDKLLDCYLRTTETVYRILHVPSFRRDYEALWVSNCPPDMKFLIQLKLVLAIGTPTYDDEFSMRSSAIKWVYEAQSWVSEPDFKSQLSIRSLQTQLLLLLAREVAGIGATLVWISAGAVLRMAVHMGLHRDPSILPPIATLAAEMRRRLWNTILEITLQSSVTSGTPPLLSMEDFDTEPLGNFDDDQLMVEGSVPQPEDQFTDTSVALALRKTFNARLTVTKFLNDLSPSGTYEESLQLDRELRAAYKKLCQTLQGCRSSSGRSTPRFASSFVDYIMRRYHLCLHTPFIGQAMHEASYAFSRKVLFETSLRIWSAVCPYSSARVTPCDSMERNDLAQLIVCGSGFFRTVAVQACFLIAAELRSQLRDEESLGPVALRPDLLGVLDEAKTFLLRPMEVGEVNIKGYLLIRLVTAHIEGIVQGLGNDEMRALIIKTAEETEETCLAIFEKKMAQTPTEGAVEGMIQMSLNTPPDMIEDWDFMVSY